MNDSIGIGDVAISCGFNIVELIGIAPIRKTTIVTTKIIIILMFFLRELHKVLQGP